MAQHTKIRVGLVGGGLSATTFHAPFLKQSNAYAITGILRASSSKPVPGLEEKNRRWDGDFLTASSLIKCGVLGRVVEFESHFDRYRPALKVGWREDAELPGTGVLYDLGSHLVDQALCLFGPPTKVTGLVINQRHLPACAVHDAFTITLQYDRPEGPLTVLLRSSSLCKIPGPRFTLHGTQGSWMKHGLDVQEAQLRAGMNPMGPGFGAEQPGSYGALDSQALELDPALAAAPAGPLEFLPEVPEGSPPPTSPAAAAAVVASEAADAALEAATAAAVAGRMGVASGAAAGVAGASAVSDGQGDDDPAAVTVASIAAAVLAKIDAGGSSTGGGGNDGARVRVVTQQGCWHKFYEEVGGLLLAAASAGGAAATQPLGVTGSSGGGGGGGGGSSVGDAVTEAAGALATGRAGVALVAKSSGGGVGSSSSSSSSHNGINSQLSVPPEAAATVIRVIQLAQQSSSEGRTLAF